MKDLATESALAFYSCIIFHGEAVPASVTLGLKRLPTDLPPSSACSFSRVRTAPRHGAWHQAPDLTQEGVLKQKSDLLAPSIKTFRWLSKSLCCPSFTSSAPSLPSLTHSSLLLFHPSRTPNRVPPQALCTSCAPCLAFSLTTLVSAQKSPPQRTLPAPWIGLSC